MLLTAVDGGREAPPNTWFDFNRRYLQWWITHHLNARGSSSHIVAMISEVVTPSEDCAAGTCYPGGCLGVQCRLPVSVESSPQSMLHVVFATSVCIAGVMADTVIAGCIEDWAIVRLGDCHFRACKTAENRLCRRSIIEDARFEFRPCSCQFGKSKPILL
jgi:hypothetical protein